MIETDEISWQLAAGRIVACRYGQRGFHPGVRQIIVFYLDGPLEYLEMMTRLIGRPERDHGLQRWAAGQGTGEFGHHYRFFWCELEARAGPRFDMIERVAMFGAFLESAQHVEDLFSNQSKKLRRCVDRNSTQS